MLSKELKEQIKKELVQKIKAKLESHDFSEKSGNPFVDIVFGKYSNIKTFIHGTATMLGSYYEILARNIAEENPNFIEVKKLALVGKISNSESAVITNIAKDLEEKKRKSSYGKEVEEIYAADSSGLHDTKITIDLYLKNKKSKEFFIEMKGPDPNKKEVRAAKEDLLNVVAIKKRDVKLKEFDDKVAIIFGVYYNNEEGEYNNWKVSPLFEKKKGLLVQEEFWDLIGGRGTYGDLLGVLEEVRVEISPLIKETIEKNF